MRNGLLLFLGVFLAFALSWAGLLLTAHRQLGSLAQFKDPVDETLNPALMSGPANQGRLVYQDLGCVTCHTQQVRREGYGSDLARKWGQRGSYARDYIRDQTVFLGSSRIGPDLRNTGSTELHSYADADYFYRLLYAPQSVAPGTNMPAYTFLFDVHPVAGRQPSHLALRLTGKSAPAEGLEVVPTYRARALVAYLQSLKDTYDYPLEKSRNAPAEQPKEEGKKSSPPAAGAAEKPKEAGKAVTQPDPAAPAEKPKEGGH
jgi:cytochrome c oxidase cbb3-type subunit 2